MNREISVINSLCTLGTIQYKWELKPRSNCIQLEAQEVGLSICAPLLSRAGETWFIPLSVVCHLVLRLPLAWDCTPANAGCCHGNGPVMTAL